MIKLKKFSLGIVLILIVPSGYSQSVIKPLEKAGLWTVYNREVSFDSEQIYLNSATGDGVLWLDKTDFRNGVIELDIKGKDARGQSFVGIAFHGKDNDTFDGVYFRPFNFKSPERKSHSVQYISMPENEWSVLRENFPGKYESEISPVPDPNGWFHAKIEVDGPFIKVYVNGSKTASLEVEKISDQAEGKIGLWVGNGSEGWFKNFTITTR
ncbi:MAG: DUF1080 domain-containing protein [Marinoscillum sp.]